MKKKKCNDPSAGSPTDTLLRLLLPLDDTIRGNLVSDHPPRKRETQQTSLLLIEPSNR